MAFTRKQKIKAWIKAVESPKTPPQLREGLRRKLKVMGIKV